jgi:hypothetical protein
VEWPFEENGSPLSGDPSIGESLILSIMKSFPVDRNMEMWMGTRKNRTKTSCGLLEHGVYFHFMLPYAGIIQVR